MRRFDDLTQRGRDVLRHFAAHRDPIPLTLTAIARRLDVHRSTVLYHAGWLARAGFLVRCGAGPRYLVTGEGRAAAKRMRPASPTEKAEPKRHR